MTLSIKDRIELSKTIGAPIDGILEKGETFISQIETILHKTADGPREAVILLAMTYLYFSLKYSIGQTDDAIERAKDFLDSVVGLIHILGEDDE